jgi:capsular exopolysaccharide synthesis family protein
MDKNKGITTFVQKGGDIDNYIQKTDTENLSVLCSGPIPPNPSEMLGSIKLKKLMESLKDKFDVIILDTPPLIAVTDAFITASYVDQLLLVIRSGVTHKGALDRSITNLNNNGIKVYGTVLNAASEATSYGGGYYYDYYQYYYGNDEGDQ